MFRLDIYEIENWCKIKQVVSAQKKCVAVSFSRSRNQLPAVYFLHGPFVQTVTSKKDLGMIIDSKLTFSEHIDGITLRACRRLGFICRSSKELKNIKALVHLFSAFVRPTLEYGSVV